MIYIWLKYSIIQYVTRFTKITSYNPDTGVVTYKGILAPTDEQIALYLRSKIRRVK
jgi:hypothetical protein